jgi:hypothetical protein
MNRLTTTSHNINRFTMQGKTWVNITRSMHHENRTINIAGDTEGSCPIGTNLNASHGSYYPNFMKEAVNSYQFVRGEVTITKIDTVNNILNATFSGTVRNAKNEELIIKDGKVENGELKKGVTVF